MDSVNLVDLADLFGLVSFVFFVDWLPSPTTDNSLLFSFSDLVGVVDIIELDEVSSLIVIVNPVNLITS